MCINKTPVEYNPKTKKLQQKCLGMKCTNQIPIKSRGPKKPKRNPDDSDFRHEFILKSSSCDVILICISSNLIALAA